MKVRDGITICTICITACIISTKEIEDGTKLKNVLRFSHLRSQTNSTTNWIDVINESAGESKFILQLFEYHRDIRGLSPGSIILKVWGREKTPFLSMIISK